METKRVSVKRPMEEMENLKEVKGLFRRGMPNYEVFIDADGKVQVLEQQVFLNTFQGKRVKMLSERIVADVPCSSRLAKPFPIAETDDDDDDDEDDCIDDFEESDETESENEDSEEDESEDEDYEYESQSDEEDEPSEYSCSDSEYPQENKLNPEMNLSEQPKVPGVEPKGFIQTAFEYISSIFQPVQENKDEYIVFI